jgi:circadian clock protein KaiC
MIQRISTGQGHLDDVLGGGFAEHSIILLAGSPGTGKTMLAQQFLFHNATADRPGLYLTTTSEPLDKVVRFGQELSFFDPTKVGTAILFESLAPALEAGGLPAVSERIHTLIRDARPGILIIDSFKAFAPYADDALVYRAFVAELAGRVTPLPITTFWVGEYGPGELMDLPEAAVADCIIHLRSVLEGKRTARHLQVLKLRGGDFMSGQHAYRLTDSGLRAFPRLADPVDDTTVARIQERASTGTEGLDRMLDGGVFRGSTTLAIGPSGAGKTMLSMQFLAAGGRSGLTGVFATLQENPNQLARLLDRDGSGEADERIVLHRRSPVDVYIDEWVYDLFERIESSGAELLVIDSLSDLRMASPDLRQFDEYVYSLVQRLASLKITTIMTLESPPSLGFADLPTTTVSHLADNIILLGYQVEGSTVRHGIHVLKARASRHDREVRELRIHDTGIEILDPMDVVASYNGGEVSPARGAPAR